MKRWRRSSDLCRGLIVEHAEHQAVNAWRKTSFRGKPMKLTVFFKLRSSVKRLAHGMLELAKQIPIASEPEEELLEDGESDAST